MDNGAQLAVDAINEAGGIESLGGAQLELASADTQGAPEVGQSEAQPSSRTARSRWWAPTRAR